MDRTIALFFAICLAISSASHAQHRELIYFTSFETGQDKWEAPGDRNHWNYSSSHTYRGQFCRSIDEGVNYRINHDYIVSEPIVLPTGYQKIYVEFYADPEMKRCGWEGMPGWIDELFSLRLDNLTDGQWDIKILSTYDKDFPAPSNGYELFAPTTISSGSLEITGYSGKEIRLRMGFQTDALDSPKGHGFYLDNVSIIGETRYSNGNQLANDDGFPDDGLNVAAGETILGKFNPFAKFEKFQLTNVAFYLYQNDGDPVNLVGCSDNDGTPEEELFAVTINPSDLVAGWNETEIPETVVITEGSFYLGITGPLENSTVALDWDNSGESYSYHNSALTEIESGNIMIRPSMLDVTDTEDEIRITEFALKQNYPNPFSKSSGGNSTTTIEYSLPTSQTTFRQVTIKVYDILGREAATLINKAQPPGNYEVKWNAANYPSGIYIYKLTAGSFIDAKKMLIIK